MLLMIGPLALVAFDTYPFAFDLRKRFIIRGLAL
jgi:hypothetical protein